MADDTPVSKRELLRLSARRVGEAGAFAAELVVDSVAERFLPAVQRPPGAIAEVNFLLACTRCGRCAAACPPGAIMLLDDSAGLAAGTPFLDVNRHKPCVVCSHLPCISACDDDALLRLAARDIVMGTAELDRAECRAWNGTPCSRCFDACPVRDTAMVVDEQGRPYVDPRHCIGCGMCRAACPTDPKSIKIKPPPLL